MEGLIEHDPWTPSSAGLQLIGPPTDTWAVYENSDKIDPHTTVHLKTPQNEKMVEFRPSSRVYVAKMSLPEWIASRRRPQVDMSPGLSIASKNVFDSMSDRYANTRIFFTASPPQTHIFCDDHAMIVEDLVKVVFAPHIPNACILPSATCMMPSPLLPVQKALKGFTQDYDKDSSTFSSTRAS